MASLFQVTFIAAICATLVAFDWRLGATVSLIAFVALCRTTLFCVYRRARTIPAGSWELVGAFLQSMAFVGTIATCSVIAFLMTCTPCAIMAKSWQMGTIAGSAFGGLTFALLLWLTPVFRGPN